MYPITKMHTAISVILLIGILLSIGLVLIGGILYLYQFGGNSMDTELLQSAIYQTSIKKIWYSAFSFSPLGIIELGLIILVVTQMLRVALLTFFYITIQDYWFIFFSLIVLFVLAYSLLWRN